jgi:pyruvate/2-oxoglutarate dehydrogenase complex dihydrolipoamide acyltransferase (E2) component
MPAIGKGIPCRGPPIGRIPVSEGRARPDAEEQTPVRRGQDDGGTATDGRDRPDQREPDVLLDVENLEVEKITLEVDNLRAHISVLAELANLVNLSVGADVQLGRVKLEIDGVRAKALLKVRLENVRAILEKALDTIGEHPEILQYLAQALTEVLREALQDASSALEDVLEGLDVGDTVDEALKGKLEDISSGLEGALEGQGGEAAQGAGQLSEGGAGEARRSAGEVAGVTTDQGGRAAPGDQGSSGEVSATRAARRKAEQLGVELSGMQGSGPEGLITIRDVQAASRQG